MDVEGALHAAELAVADEGVTFATVVGSLLWNQWREGSDVDIYGVVEIDLERLAVADIPPPRRFERRVDVRGEQYVVEGIIVELSHLYRQLARSNPNAIFSVLSPLTIVPSRLLGEIRVWLLENRSKAIYPPVRGWVQSTLRAVERGKLKGAKRDKAIRTAARAAAFAVRWLRGLPITFEPMAVASPDDLRALLEELDDAYEASKLPESPDVASLRRIIAEWRARNTFKSSDGAEVAAVGGP